jgi:hypothetical protein
MNEIERKALEMLLAGDHPSLAVLREQLALADVAGRRFSGVGFFTELRVPPSARRLDDVPRLIIHDVYAEVSGLEHPVGFLLFITDGVLDTLECFIHDDQWPSSPPSLVRAYYVRTGERYEAIETADRDLSKAFK